MENKVEKALNDFIGTPECETENGVTKENKDLKRVVLEERDGLIIERIDKQYVTSDGRMLLREQY